MKKTKLAGGLAALALAACMSTGAFAECAKPGCRCGAQNCDCAYRAAVQAYQKESAAQEKAYRKAVKAYQAKIEAEQNAYRKAVKDYEKQQAEKEAAYRKAAEREQARLSCRCR